MIVHSGAVLVGRTRKIKRRNPLWRKSGNVPGRSERISVKEERDRRPEETQGGGEENYRKGEK